jgi:uncharacterized membrane-anchored protein
MKKNLLFVMAGLLAFMSVSAKTPDDDSLQKQMLEQVRRMDSVENTLHYKTGVIKLGDGIASITVPENFKFLEAAEAKYVVTDLWGNPPSNKAPLGLLFPANSGATDPGGYAFIIQFEDIGYVKDSDADKMDYDDLLKDLKKSSAEDNIERQKMGLYTMDLVGWAAKPYYDKQRKVLHWAKEFSVPGQDENTLNYDVRVLGRKGVLTLQAVSGISQLDSVNNHINDVLAMVSFNDGHKYADFNSSTDNVAAWTVGGLVAGKVLAKVGFFAVILKFLKFIIIGIGLIGAAVWRFITGRKKKEEEFVYQPQPSPARDTDNTNPPA